MNCTGERLTDICSAGQAARLRQAVRSTHSPSATISPVSSATRMNSPGGTRPRSGWCQRTSASTPDRSLVAELDLRLVVQLELVAGEREAQVALERLARLQPRVHAGLEEAEGVAAFLLGAIERDVGVLQQPPGIEPSSGISAMPMLAVTSDLVAVEVERRGQRLEDAAAELLRAVGLLDADLDDRELVAADARDRVGLAHAGLQALGAALDQQVAGGVAERVVDVLEAVEIEAAAPPRRRRAGRPSRSPARGARRSSSRLGSSVSGSCRARYWARRSASISAVMSVAVPR